MGRSERLEGGDDRRASPILPALAAALGGALLLGLARLEPATFEAAFRRAAADERTGALLVAALPALRLRLFLAGLVLLLAAALLAIGRLGLGRRAARWLGAFASLPGRLLWHLRAFVAREPGQAALVGLASAVGLALGLARLGQTLQADEANTFLHYVRQPSWIWSGSTTPPTTTSCTRSPRARACCASARPRGPCGCRRWSPPCCASPPPTRPDERCSIAARRSPAPS